MNIFIKFKIVKKNVKGELYNIIQVYKRNGSIKSYLEIVVNFKIDLKGINLLYNLKFVGENL